MTYELMLCFGMLFAGVADYALRGFPNNWRWMVAAPAVPAAAMVLGIYVLPESPRWLVVRGRLRDALHILHGVRGGGAVPFRAESGRLDGARRAELMDLWSAVEKEKEARKVRRGGEEAGEIGTSPTAVVRGADGDSRVDDVRADEDEDEDDLSAASSQSGSFFRSWRRFVP